MQVYKYNEKTKEYTEAELALLDPLETQAQGKSVFLLPANATFSEPTKKDGYAAVWNGTQWDLVEDNRGVNYWLAGDTYDTPAHEMKELGALPDGAVTVRPAKALDAEKEEKLTQAKTLFAEKRDAIRFITLDDVTYGFDCASEDITNFMAAWKDAEMNGSTQYKVWTSETDKGVVTLTNDNFNTVFKAVRNSQFEAYAWLTTVQAQIEACTTAEEIEAVEM